LEESVKRTRWSELSGQERYRVVELARKGEMAVSELCKTFEMSRQTLYRAMEAADRVAAQALEPKPRGRKPKSQSELVTDELAASNAELTKELEHWKKKYAVARTLLDLERKLDRGESLPGEKEGKKTRRTKGKT
jgi:transposase-like protein